MSRVVIADIHGDQRIIPRVIQSLREKHGITPTDLIILGDIGIGFPSTQLPPADLPMPVKIIRGNHDDPAYWTGASPNRVFWEQAGYNFVDDGTLDDGILYIGGAASVDYKLRLPGLDWWPEEELSDREWQKILASLQGREHEVHTVLSHDAPAIISTKFLYPGRAQYYSRTSSYLDSLSLMLPQVTTWLYGHHHVLNIADYSSGTKFICMPDAGRIAYLLDEGRLVNL